MVEETRVQSLGSRDLFREVFGYLYVWWWGKRAAIRYRVEKTSIFILIGFILIVLAEVSLENFGVSWGRHSSIWARALFYLLIFVVLYSKLREYGQHGRQIYFVGAAKTVTELLTPNPHALPRDYLIKEMLAVICGGFRCEASAKMALSRNGLLETEHFFPETRPPNQTRLRIDQGGSGYAFQNKCLVYIPRTSLRHGIIQNFRDPQPYTMVARIFEEVGPHEYESVLCVPIMAKGHCFGVLCVDSPKANAFRRLDFEQTMFYGFVLALILLPIKDGESEEEP